MSQPVQLVIFHDIEDLGLYAGKIPANAVINVPHPRGGQPIQKPVYPEIMVNLEVNPTKGEVMVISDPDVAQAMRTIQRNFRDEIEVRGEVNTQFTEEWKPSDPLIRLDVELGKK